MHRLINSALSEYYFLRGVNFWSTLKLHFKYWYYTLYYLLQ